MREFLKNLLAAIFCGMAVAIVSLAIYLIVYAFTTGQPLRGAFTLGGMTACYFYFAFVKDGKKK